MADKEERITIHQVLYPCKKCSINCNKNDWKNCDFYQNYISGMTRQEAIERMAKAAKKAYRGYFYTEPHHPNISDIMEAALNALLEGHDDER